MKKVIASLVLAATLLIFTMPVNAEIRAKTFSITPFLGGYTFEGNEELKTRPVFGLRFGYDFTEKWGLEGALDYLETSSKAVSTDADVYGYRVEALYHFMSGKRFVPFIAAGIGGRSLRYEKILNDRNHALFDYGVGLKYFLSDRIALRGDIRHLILGNDTTHNLEYTIGLTYYFGAAARTIQVEAEDADNDGVYDDRDKCPGTPVGVKVDQDGCPLDSDRDGVYDYLDKCPGTPEGVKVDQDGCPLDSDRDGVYDYLDKCPGTPEGGKVDQDGCPIVEQRREPEAAAPAPVVEEQTAKREPEAAAPAPVVEEQAVRREAAAAVAQEMFEKGRAAINIEFDFDKASVKKQYHEELQKFADVMKNYPDLSVIIEGHTDSIGEAAYNEKLSLRRADSVKTYLTEKFGIAESRLTSKGYGETRPVDTNKTAAGRRKNRRVEAAVDYMIKK